MQSIVKSPKEFKKGFWTLNFPEELGHWEKYSKTYERKKYESICATSMSYKMI